jgi:hypothetical protein
MYRLGMAPSTPSAPAFVRLAGHPLRWQLPTALAHSNLRVRELVVLIGLISYHLRPLRAGGLVTARRSSFDGRDSYYHLDLERCAQALADTGAALHPALAAPEVHSERFARSSVLFVCTGNSARSPIAEALLRRHTAGHAQVTSAGSYPKPRLHPHAVRVPTPPAPTGTASTWSSSTWPRRSTGFAKRGCRSAASRCPGRADARS